MVDQDLLRRKTAQVLHHVARLRARADLSAERIAADEDLWNTLAMDLQQAIQACIDLVVHACVDDGLGTPGGPAEAFALLARHGRIDAALAERLTGAAGLRNLIVYRYADLDTGRLLAVIRNDLGDLEALLRALRG